MTALSSLAPMKLRLLFASNGSDAWPSCDMQLASNTDTGVIPVAYRLRNIICGPESGIIPISDASSISVNVLDFIHGSRSM